MRILESESMLSEEEVAAYDILTRKYLKVLHYGFIETVINQSPANGSFLDVGTGTGWIGIGVAKHNPEVNVTGIDLSENMLKVAVQNSIVEGVNERISFNLCDAKRLPFANATFDSVFCHNMIHHLPNPDELIREMMRVVKADGAILIRDLVRYSKFVAKIHVNLFGITYNKLMKKEYYDSILAALTESEWKKLFATLNIRNSRITKQFVTHMSIERSSSRRRPDNVFIEVPVYLKPLKYLYTSKV